MSELRKVVLTVCGETIVFSVTVNNCVDEKRFIKDMKESITMELDNNPQVKVYNVEGE